MSFAVTNEPAGSNTSKIGTFAEHLSTEHDFFAELLLERQTSTKDKSFQMSLGRLLKLFN